MSGPAALTSEEWKNRLDGLKTISATHRAAREERRKAQIQGFFTTLTFYALVVAAKVTGRLVIPGMAQPVFIVSASTLLAAVAIFSSAYLLGLNAANRVNRELAENAEGEMLRMLGLPGPTQAGRTIAKTYLWEIGMIWVFAGAACIALAEF